MKIYDMVKMDLDGKIVEEDSYEYDGQVALCGGGSTGMVSLPSDPGAGFTALSNTTRSFTVLVHAAKEMIIDALPATTVVGGTVGSEEYGGGGVSPYYDSYDADSVQVYDPDTDLAAVQTRLAALQVVIDAINPVTNHSTYNTAAVTAANTIVDNALTKANAQTDDAVAVALAAATDVVTEALAAATTASASDEVDDLVDSFEEESRLEYLRGVSRFTAGMSDINAVNSSAFIFGLAIMERQRLSDVSKYRRELAVRVLSESIASFVSAYGTVISANINSFASMLGLPINMVKDMVGMLGMKTGAMGADAHLTGEVRRIKIGAKSEEIFDQLKIDEADALWDFNLFQYGANMIASPSGAAMIPGKLTKAQSILGGATSGAAVGGAIGGPKGAGIGAVVGAIAGALD